MRLIKEYLGCRPASFQIVNDAHTFGLSVYLRSVNSSSFDHGGGESCCSWNLIWVQVDGLELLEKQKRNQINSVRQ